MLTTDATVGDDVGAVKERERIVLLCSLFFLLLLVVLSCFDDDEDDAFWRQLTPIVLMGPVKPLRIDVFCVHMGMKKAGIRGGNFTKRQSRGCGFSKMSSSWSEIAKKKSMINKTIVDHLLLLFFLSIYDPSWCFLIWSVDHRYYSWWLHSCWRRGRECCIIELFWWCFCEDNSPPWGWCAQCAQPKHFESILSMCTCGWEKRLFEGLERRSSDGGAKSQKGHLDGQK